MYNVCFYVKKKRKRKFLSSLHVHVKVQTFLLCFCTTLGNKNKREGITFVVFTVLCYILCYKKRDGLFTFHDDLQLC